MRGSGASLHRPTRTSRPQLGEGSTPVGGCHLPEGIIHDSRRVDGAPKMRAPQRRRPRLREIHAPVETGEYKGDPLHRDEWLAASRRSMPIRIETEWVDTAAISGAELSATWASLRIRVDDAVVTRIVDRTDTVRSRVYVPLYPLAESLVTNWWFLLHEVENPAKATDAAFRRRHALVSAPEGYAFPNLQLMPSGERVHLAWTGERRHWSRIEFLNEGEAWVDLDEFRECCCDLVDRDRPAAAGSRHRPSSGRNVSAGGMGIGSGG